MNNLNDEVYLQCLHDLTHYNYNSQSLMEHLSYKIKMI